MKPILRTTQVLICIVVPLLIGWIMRCAVDWEGPDTPGVMVSTISEYPALRVCLTAFISAVLETRICA